MFRNVLQCDGCRKFLCNQGSVQCGRCEDIGWEAIARLWKRRPGLVESHWFCPECVKIQDRESLAPPALPKKKTPRKRMPKAISALSPARDENIKGCAPGLRKTNFSADESREIREFIAAADTNPGPRRSVKSLDVARDENVKGEVK